MSSKRKKQPARKQPSRTQPSRTQVARTQLQPVTKAVPPTPTPTAVTEPTSGPEAVGSAKAVTAPKGRPTKARGAPVAKVSPRDDGVVRLAWGGAALHAVSAVTAVLVPGARGPHAVVSLSLFAAGSAMTLLGFVVSLGRSRDEVVDLGGVFWLSGGAAPKQIARSLRSCLLVQTVAAFAAASARPYTSLAFSLLTPMWALGALALWGGRKGTFKARPPARRPGAR